MQCSHFKKEKVLQLQISVRTGFLNPENMGKDTKIEFLSQIYRKLWVIKHLAHLAQTAILIFAYMTEKYLKVLKRNFFDSYDIYEMSKQ